MDDEAQPSLTPYPGLELPQAEDHSILSLLPSQDLQFFPPPADGNGLSLLLDQDLQFPDAAMDGGWLSLAPRPNPSSPPAGLYAQRTILPAHVEYGNATEPTQEPAPVHSMQLVHSSSPQVQGNSTLRATANIMGPSKDEWAAHRMRIKELYIDEIKKLEDVRRIMREKYSFHAS